MNTDNYHSRIALKSAITKALKLMNNRVVILNPWKLDTFHHIGRWCFAAREWAAWKILMMNTQQSDALNTGWRVRLNFPQEHAISYLTLTTISDSYPVATTLFNNLPTEVQEYINAWSEVDWKLKHEAHEVASHVQGIVATVNTIGQLARLWPFAVTLVSHTDKEKINNARAKSRLPAGATESAWLKKEALEITEHLLLEASLLPEATEDTVSSLPQINYRTNPYS